MTGSIRDPPGAGVPGWLEALVASSGVVVGICDRSGAIKELIGNAAPEHSSVSSVAELVHPDDRASVTLALEAASTRGVGSSATSSCRVATSSGAWRDGAITFGHLREPDDRFSITFEPGVARVRPGSSRFAGVPGAKLFAQVRADPLTGLPGRDHLLEALGQAGPLATETAQVLVVSLDLDHFRLLNGSIGPEAGDTILLHVADRLRVLARPEGVVARLGADDFGLVLAGIQGFASAARVARRILQVVASPIVVGDDEVSVTASLGICLLGEWTGTPAEVLRDADEAQLGARRRGGGRYELFLPGPVATEVPRSGIVGRLHGSIDRSELELLYQPVAQLSTGKFVDAEALVRWHHPEYGLLLPDQFVPAAEQTGFIIELGTWVIREACRTLGSWSREVASHPGPLRTPRASVNVSTLQLARPGFAAMVREAIAGEGIEPDQLGLEITESALMADLERSTDALWQLRSDGVRIMADDFGTGYSSLAYLSRLPLDALKIDRGFIAELDRKSASAVLVRGIVDLAQSLGIVVIAEGVETAGQLEALAAMECDYAQGFLLAFPAPASEVGPLLGTTPPALRGRRAS